MNLKDEVPMNNLNDVPIGTVVRIVNNGKLEDRIIEKRGVSEGGIYTPTSTREIWDIANTGM